MWKKPIRVVGGLLAVPIVILVVVAIMGAMTTSTGTLLTGNRPVTHDVPWMLFLESGHAGCGAVLIGPQAAVTAAHCVAVQPPEIAQQQADGDAACGPSRRPAVAGPSTITVRAGSRLYASGGNLIQVTTVAVHPAWNWNRKVRPGQPRGDIAVLHLAQPVALPPIRLATTPSQFGEPTMTYGWGVQEDCGDYSPGLRQYAGTVSDAATCRPSVPWSPGDLCSVPTRRAGGPCDGDSGGPLVRQTSTGPELVGVVSRGTYCGGPARYSAISYFHPFITDMAS